MTTLFISDLHLEADRPDIGKQFLAFLTGEACRAAALYILGDLFETWLGDDDPDPYYAGMKSAIHGLTEAGVPVYFMHGNRDFMIGEGFADDTGATLLDDPTPVELFGQRVLLSHGDALCTDDVEYQTIRAMTRDPNWQTMMRTKSIEERSAIAVEARRVSMARNQTLDDDIMDVNKDAVVAAIREHGVDILLHGHTHRPAVHDVDLGDRNAQRIVLGDWYEQGSVVRWDASGPQLCSMKRQSASTSE